MFKHPALRGRILLAAALQTPQGGDMPFRTSSLFIGVPLWLRALVASRAG
jgi:hypothetical protein